MAMSHEVAQVMAEAMSRLPLPALRLQVNNRKLIEGFYRGVFDATRFQGGGLTPEALTEVLFVGPLNPSYVNPVQGDFVAAGFELDRLGPNEGRPVVDRAERCPARRRQRC